MLMLWLLQHSLRVRAHKSVVFEKNSKMLTGPTSSRVRTKECIKHMLRRGNDRDESSEYQSTKYTYTATFQYSSNTAHCRWAPCICARITITLPPLAHVTSCFAPFPMLLPSFRSLIRAYFFLYLCWTCLSVCVCVTTNILDLCWICLYTHCFCCIVTKSFKARGEKKEHTKDLNL